MRFLLFKLAHRCTFFSMICSVLLIGCGKKVNVIEEDSTRQDQYLLPGSVFIEAEKLKEIYGQNEVPVPSELQHIDGEYIFPKLAKVYLPESIHITSGNAGNHYAYVFINEYENAYDYYCVYKGGSNTSQPGANTTNEINGLKYNFEDCYDDNGNSLGLEPGDRAWIEKDKSIEVHLEGADPRYDTKAITAIDVDWT